MLDFIRLRVVNAASRLIVIVLVLAVGCALSGCGKKPGRVDPPPGVGKDAFPRIYPDPTMDPQP